MTRAPGEPTIEDIDALLRFAPVLERPDFTPGVLHQDGPEGAAAPPRFEASPEMNDFLQALHDHRFICDFDWSEWQEIAQSYVSHPERLADVGVGTLRKLFTTHVQKERFSGGHLAAVARAGHLLALLRRLDVLRARIAAG